MIFGGMFFLRNTISISDNAKPFIVTGAITFVFFGVIQFLFNQFGYDRNGFRTLVLLPVKRQYILMGKNLAIMPIAMSIGLTLLLIAKFALDISAIVILAAAMQLAAGFLLLSIAGNLSSILAPYRIAQGSLKPTKVPFLMTLIMIATHLMFPMLMIPIFLPPLLGLLFSALGVLPPLR